MMTIRLLAAAAPAGRGVPGQTLMKTLAIIVVLAMFAAFAWYLYLLPSPPRTDAEQPPGGHAGHAGDKVRFHAHAIDGAFTATSIEIAN
jgi:hypothetical protein